MSVRPWMPSWLLASCRPLFARKLNERSLRPPMSVTSPTLICLPDEAVDDEPLLLPLVELPLSLLPHAATPRAPTARLRAITIALDLLRCTAPPFGIPPRRARPPAPVPRGSLRPGPVGVADTVQQPRTPRLFREARLDRGARERDQVGVAPPEPLARDRVLAAHARAEVGRVVGGERDADPGLAEGGEGVGLEAVEHPEHDVARRAALEDDAAIGDLRDEGGVLDRADAVADAGHREVEGGADALGPGPLARVDAAAQARGGRDGVGLGERAGRVAGLVAGHLEADDVGVRPPG